MPCLVVGVGCAEPPPADLAVICSRGVAWFIHRRYRLAGANDVSGFCLILVLQHSPSSQAILRAFSDVVGGPGGRASTNLCDNFLQRACIKSRRNCSTLALLACFPFLKCGQETKNPCTSKRAKQYDHGIEIQPTTSVENANSKRPLRPFAAGRPTQHYCSFRNQRKNFNPHAFLPARAVGRDVEHIFPSRQPPHPNE